MLHECFHAYVYSKSCIANRSPIGCTLSMHTATYIQLPPLVHGIRDPELELELTAGDSGVDAALRETRKIT